MSKPIGGKPLRAMSEPELARVMRAAAKSVEAELPPGTVFVVLAFDDTSGAQYISNGHRADVVAAMREAAERIEANRARERVPFVE